MSNPASLEELAIIYEKRIQAKQELRQILLSNFYRPQPSWDSFISHLEANHKRELCRWEDDGGRAT